MALHLHASLFSPAALLLGMGLVISHCLSHSATVATCSNEVSVISFLGKDEALSLREMFSKPWVELLLLQSCGCAQTQRLGFQKLSWGILDSCGP